MKFTLSSDFTCNSHAFRKGEAIELLPTEGSKLILKRKRLKLIIGPIIFNYLNEIEYPTLDVLKLWKHSLISESPTRHLVEIDGTGPDGFHSWFRYLDYL